MNARSVLSRAVLPLGLLALMAGILSCATPVETGPRAWIDWPLDGHEVEVGTTVTLIAHAYATEGVAEVHLSVDRHPYRIGQPTQPGEQFVEASMEWTATEPGVYLLSITAFDTAGEASTPADVTVTVPGGEVFPSPVPTEIATAVPPEATPPPAATPLPPTATQPPPGTPPPSTPIPPPPTVAPQRPTIVSFAASPPSVVEGQCSTLSWAVEGVISAVYLDGGGVGDHDSSVECPQATTSYTLRAVGPGGETSATLTVNVTQPIPTPADTAGPSVSGIDESADPIAWPPNCPRREVTISANITDPSGVSAAKLTYRVIEGSRQGSWQAIGMSHAGNRYSATVTAQALQISLNPPVENLATLQYYIQAFDTRGNQSQTSTGTVTIEYCPG